MSPAATRSSNHSTAGHFQEPLLGASWKMAAFEHLGAGVVVLITDREGQRQGRSV
jgi:hypothetical protein